MKSFGERIRHARERMGISQSELARRIGVKPQSVQAIESGRVQRSRYAPDIARVTGVNLDWLLGQRGAKVTFVTPPPGADIQYRSAPAIDLRSAGLVPVVPWAELRRMLDNEETWEAVRWVHCPVPYKPALIALEVFGDAMDDGTPAAYQDGDILWVDTSATPRHGQDVVVLDEGDVGMIRRLQVTPEGRFLRALNPNHPDSMTRWAPGLRLVGVVVFSGRQRA